MSMAENRCPMCGKSNPEEAQRCVFCQAQLKPLAGGEEPQQPSFSFSSSDESEWLKSLRHAVGEEPSFSEETGQEEPDWLARIRQRAQTERQSTDGDKNQLSSWLSDTGGESSAAGEEDWLNQLRAVTSVSQETTEEPLLPSQEERRMTTGELRDVRDRLSRIAGEPVDLSAGVSPAPQPSETVPSSAEAEQPPQAPSGETSDLTEWLRSLEYTGVEQSSEEAKFSIPLEESTELPYSGLAEFTGESELGGGPPEGEQPDWLRAFEEAPTAAETPSAPMSGEETPDWLKAFEEAPSVEEAPSTTEPASAPVSDEETPDWLLELAQTFVPETPGDQTSPFVARVSPFAEEIPPQVEQPKEVTASALQPAAQPEPTAEAALARDVDLTDWLAELEGEAIDKEAISKAFILEEEQPPSEELPAASYPFAGIDADLLGAVEAEASKEGGLEGLAPALLPDWLQALRPVEAVLGETPAASEEELQVERAGPLAGLRGVLPADRLVIQYRKPPIYSIKLRVTEKQQRHIEALSDLIKAEGKPADIKRENLQAPRRLLRLTLALILVLVLLIPLLVSSPSLTPTGLVPGEEVRSFYSQMSLMVPDRPLLVAVDYDAGYLGEMRFAATGVIENLMLKRQRLALVSTVPSGPLLANDLLERAQLKLTQVEPAIRQGYALPDRTVTLGYLPGGITSLQEFATFPRRAVFAGLGNVAGEPQNVWGHVVVQDVHRLSDFAGLLLITDRVDTARAWIEQVEPALERRPFLVITSAQVAPMLTPYVDSGQIEAMIWGISGGMAYEQLAGVPPHAAAYWNAYRYGMYVGFAFILSGVLLRSITVAFSRRRKPNEA